MSINRPSHGWNIQRKPVHPGEMLREEFLIPFGMTGHSLAVALRIPATRVHAILNERRGVTPDTAMRLERYFGTSAEFWMNLQSQYDLTIARRERASEIAREVLARTV